MTVEAAENNAEKIAANWYGPTVRLAAVGTQCKGTRKALANPAIRDPSWLASFHYLRKNFYLADHRMVDWVLDSGAFSAFAQGSPIDVRELTEYARNLRQRDPLLSEVYALDVIGDAKRSRQNADWMNAQGVPAIPCFHYGSPLEELDALASTYPKVAIGGAARLHPDAKLNFAKSCFDRLWRSVGPVPIHGFGYGDKRFTEHLPFHSVDATSWEMRPRAFGSWHAYGRLKMGWGDCEPDLSSEFIYAERQQDRARTKWRNVMRAMHENTVARFGAPLRELLKRAP